MSLGMSVLPWDSSSHRWSKREMLFTPVLCLTVHRPAGQVVVLRGWSFAALRTWRQAGNTAKNPVLAASGSYTCVSTRAGFAQTPLETWIWGLSSSLPRSLNVQCVWGGVLVALRLKQVTCKANCSFAKWHLQEKPSFACMLENLQTSHYPCPQPFGCSQHSGCLVLWAAHIAACLESPWNRKSA